MVVPLSPEYGHFSNAYGLQVQVLLPDQGLLLLPRPQRVRPGSLQEVEDFPSDVDKNT
jgi:hypothetical protein